MVETVREQRLEEKPLVQLAELLNQLDDIVDDDSSDETQIAAERRMAGLSATLTERLLPAKIRQRLRKHWDPERSLDQNAPTLLVISDDSWIPWEFLRIRGTDQRGFYLGEAFALSRWLWDVEPTLALPCDRIGLVVSESSELSDTESEGQDIREQHVPEKCAVEDVPARYNDLLDGFASGRFSVWHFTGHGWNGEGENPDLWDLLFDEDDQTLQPSDLRTIGDGFRARRPLVFLNVCRSAQLRPALSGLGGPAAAFLDAGAGAIVGTHWAIDDAQARVFARAFYLFFLQQGHSIGEAARRARLQLRDACPGNPTWLAYTVFADPRATVDSDDRPLPARRRPDPLLEIPRREWLSDRSSPGALLRADHGVVPSMAAPTSSTNSSNGVTSPNR